MAFSNQTVAQEFSLSEEALTRESLRAYLLEQLHTLDAERQGRWGKFGVMSLAEMDALLQGGAVSEESILEDFQPVDYLTTSCWRPRDRSQQCVAG